MVAKRSGHFRPAPVYLAAVAFPAVSTVKYYHLLPALLLSYAGHTQSAPAPAAAPPGAWYTGVGVGNGLALAAGYRTPHWRAYGQLRGKWWGPDKEPKAQLFGDDLNTRSRQTEAAVLLGYSLAAGPTFFYAATGVAYVRGRELGEYRYSLRKSGLLSADATHYYAYRDYQALGLPVEVGWQTASFSTVGMRLGISAQANFNPQHTVYCGLGTVSVALKPLLGKIR